MIPSLFNGTIAPTACTAAFIPMPTLRGAEFYSLEAQLVSNYSRYLPVGAYLNHGAVNITAIDYCNITISYTHPGQNDLLHVQAWLPMTTWNGRLQAIGGGGWQAGLTYAASLSMAGAVGEGYATITTDGGLGSSLSPADWGLLSPGNVNLYGLQNLASVSLSDMATIGKGLVTSFYGEKPAYSYFNGCSQGGRQGLMLAQRYPDAFDGIAAAAPAINWTQFFMTGLWPSFVMQKFGNVPPPCEFDAIRSAAIQACDLNDGVPDGIISSSCDFDARSEVGKTIYCADFNRTLKISEKAAFIMQQTWVGPKKIDGTPIWYGLGKDVSVTGSITDLAIVPTTCGANGSCTAGNFTLAQDWIKYFLVKDESADVSRLTHREFQDFSHAGVQQYDSVIGTNDPDLSSFRARGGKMITYHGMSDSLIPVNGSIQYYESVLKNDPNAGDFYRLFLAPGLRHCFSGAGPYPHSAFESLRKWTEEGVVPDILPAMSVDTEPILYRNLCAFPKTPVYNGDLKKTGYQLYSVGRSALWHEHVGKSFFEDANAWIALTEIFEAVLRDSSLRTTYLIVDALDECVSDSAKLLDFIAKSSSAYSSAKWIVSSRNWPDIEDRLEQVEHDQLNIELNAEPVAAAVAMLIQRKVSQLAQNRGYSEELQDAVLQYLMANARDTFLWVALVCQDLKTTPRWNVRKKLASFPPELDSLYRRMMLQISESDSAKMCQQIIASAAILYRPVAIPELVSLVNQLDHLLDDLELVRDVINLCGSFLTVQDGTVYFVHQSAKDFVFANVFNKTFPDKIRALHEVISTRSIAVLSRTLHRDMYKLVALGTPIEDVALPDPDPLAASRYACVHWIDHLHDSHTTTTPTGKLSTARIIDEFLKTKYLYRLEGLSHLKSIEAGIVSMTKLLSLTQELGHRDEFALLVQDAQRFILYHKVPIKGFLLQTYASALVFSPRASIIKKLFQHEEIVGFVIRPVPNDKWSACLQTLESHSSDVGAVAFSDDSTLLASGSDDLTIRIWDIGSGACVHTLEGHTQDICSVQFSPASSRLASGSRDDSVRIWDTRTGACLYTLLHQVPGRIDHIRNIAFSGESTQLASAGADTIIIWDVSSGLCLQSLKTDAPVNLIGFSHHSMWYVTVDGSTIKIWDASNGTCFQNFQALHDCNNVAAFSPDLTRHASASEKYDGTVQIWDVNNGVCLQKLEVGGNQSPDVRVVSVAFSHDSSQLSIACLEDDCKVRIWDMKNGTYSHTLKGHNDDAWSVAFSHDSQLLASGSGDNTIKIWDLRSALCAERDESHRYSVDLVSVSEDLSRIASVSRDLEANIEIWAAHSMEHPHTLEGKERLILIKSLAFSSDSTQLVARSYDHIVKVWDVNSGLCIQTLQDPNDTFKLGSSTSLITSFGYHELLTQDEQNPAQGLAVSSNCVWISENAQNLLWLPIDYRPECAASLGKFIVMGTRSGRVRTCQINDSDHAV